MLLLGQLRRGNYLFQGAGGDKSLIGVGPRERKDREIVDSKYR